MSLMEELERLKKATWENADLARQLVAQRDALAAENARLREALEEIAAKALDRHHAAHIASAAIAKARGA